MCVWAVYYKQIRKSEQRPPLHLRAADLVQCISAGREAARHQAVSQRQSTAAVARMVHSAVAQPPRARTHLRGPVTRTCRGPHEPRSVLAPFFCLCSPSPQQCEERLVHCSRRGISFFLFRDEISQKFSDVLDQPTRKFAACAGSFLRGCRTGLDCARGKGAALPSSSAGRPDTSAA